MTGTATGGSRVRRSLYIGHGLGNRVGLQNRLSVGFDPSVTCALLKDKRHEWQHPRQEVVDPAQG